MSGLRSPRRKFVDGHWYEARPGGGWVIAKQQHAVDHASAPWSVASQQAAPIVTTVPPTAVEVTSPAPDVTDKPVKPPKRPKSFKRKLRWIIISVAIIIAAACAAAFIWYQSALRPVSDDKDNHVRVTIEEGSTPAAIGQQLLDEQLIRSTLAFDIYTRLAGTRGTLQLGTYILSSSQSTGDIADHIASGKIDSFPITFYPGGTLTDTTDTPINKKTDVQTALLRAGYSQASINEAFAASYDSPLFQGKPAGASLEGYVFGETYSIDPSMTATQVLQMTFNEYEKYLTDNNLVAGFKKQGFTLYQGITMASIVQREMGSHPADMPQVAQIFLKRLKDKMPLGADATFVYAAHQANRTPTVDFDSPYNTRTHTGLPPGPIGSPGLSSLKAVANPAKGNYLYFVSGDNDKTYYAKTLEKHENNTGRYCRENCSLF